MKTPEILQREALPAAAGVSSLAKVRFARIPYPGLLKEPAHFWDEIFIANEAYMLEGVTHPRIRRRLAYDAIQHRLLLEYIEGETLYDLVKAGATIKDPVRTHSILQSLAETLADLHAGVFCNRPIVHNDLKSINVLIPADAPQEMRLIDFTHSYFDGHLPPFIADKKHNPAGTAKYMAPEKWDGDFSQGFKGDVFAFGVLAYFVQTGKHPFDAEEGGVEKQIRETVPASPIEFGPHVLRNIASIIMACLEKKPAGRPSMDYVARCFADSASLLQVKSGN